MAQWTVTHLINRTDVWGRYLPTRLRTTKVRSDGTHFVDRTRTAPARDHRGKILLDADTLARHFAGRDVGHLVGLHTTAPNNTSRWGAIEIDNHGGADPGANFRAAEAWRVRLVSLGFDPTLTDSNGDGGYHLLVLFDRPVPTPRLFQFLQDVVADYATHGLANKPETFPKQACLGPGEYGNWLRLPGRHHTRPHWTRLWAGGRWCDGDGCMELLMHARGDDPALIPAPTAVSSPTVCSVKPPQLFELKPAGMTDREIAVACLRAIGGYGVDDYHTWVQVGMSLHSVGDASLLSEWEAWSRGSGKFTDGECRRKWQTFRPTGGVTLGTLVHMARAAGLGVFPRKGRAA